jgi:hypothetical protein
MALVQQSQTYIMSKSPINFDKTIAGVNITEKGIRSISKTIKVGPFQLTLNGRRSGVRASISIPGTGLSKQGIELIKF